MRNRVSQQSDPETVAVSGLISFLVAQYIMPLLLSQHKVKRGMQHKENCRKHKRGEPMLTFMPRKNARIHIPDQVPPVLILLTLLYSRSTEMIPGSLPISASMS